MRRKAGALLALEVQILRAGIDFAMAGDPNFHGYAVAARMREEGGRSLAAQGTLYRALARLEERGLVLSEWEDPALAAAEERPRRRLYRVTAAGEQAAQAEPASEQRPSKLRRAEAPQ